MKKAKHKQAKAEKGKPEVSKYEAKRRVWPPLEEAEQLRATPTQFGRYLG